MACLHLYSMVPTAPFCADEDGTAILSVDRGRFFSLVGLGNRIWTAAATIKSPVTIDALADVVAGAPEFRNYPEFEVERVIRRFMDRFVELGLVRRNDISRSVTGRTWTSLVCRLVAQSCWLATGILVTRHRTRIAAFVQFLTFQAVRWIGGFQARHDTVRDCPIVNNAPAPVDIAGVCEDVDRAAAWYPRKSLCLQRASVIACLLRQHGIDAELRIGVHRVPFASHAWVEVDGDVVGDHPGVQSYFKVICAW